MWQSSGGSRSGANQERKLKMSLGLLKKLQVLVGICVVGVVVSFAMTVVTVVQRHHAEAAINPATIPVPAQ